MFLPVPLLACYATANCANGINVKSNFYVNADAFHFRADMTFPHVDQSSLFFNMFVLLRIGQKLHTQFFTPFFFYGS
jgi:hypothetical protein